MEREAIALPLPIPPSRQIFALQTPLACEDTRAKKYFWLELQAFFRSI